MVRVLPQLRAPRARSCPQPRGALKRAGDLRRVAVGAVRPVGSGPLHVAALALPVRARDIAVPATLQLGAGTGHHPPLAACGRSLGVAATGEPFFFR